MVNRQLILGVRRLPGRGVRHKRQYESRFRDGGAASCSLKRLDELLEARSTPADFWAVVGAADAAFEAGDDRLLDWPSGIFLDVESNVAAQESLRRDGVWIGSSAGYRVRSTGRAGFEYEDQDGPLHVDSEWMASPKAVIYTRSLPVDRPQVLERLMRCWLWARFDIDLEPPSPWT